MPYTDISPRGQSQRQARLAYTPSSPTDKELVKAAKGGHTDSCDALFERHSQSLFCTAYRITRNREDAEDAVQTALLSAFVHLAKFDGRSAIATWLTRITMNSALMLLRKKRAVLMEPIDKSCVAESADLPDSSLNPEETCAWEEQKRILSGALNKLSPRVRKAIELRELKELTTQETSQVMGITASAVKARVFHGRTKLRETLRRRDALIYGSWWSRTATRRFFRNRKGRHL